MSFPWDTAGYGTRRPDREADARMRISDADRKQVADVLSKHFAEGRLDNVEFDERLGKVMAAKTRGDLAGLLDDLPAAEPPAQQAARPPARPRRTLRVLATVLLVLAAISILTAPWHFHWLLLGVVLFFLLNRYRWGYRRSYRRYRAGPGSCW